MSIDILDEHRSQLNRADASKLLTALAYDNSTKIWTTTDGCIAFGFISNPLVGAGEQTADKLSTLLSQAWPEDSMMSISLWSCPDIQTYLSDIVALRRASNFGNQEILERFIRDKAEFFEAGTKKRLNAGMYTTLRDFISIITVKIPCKRNGLPSDEDWAVATELRATVERALEGLGLAPTVFNADLYIHYTSTMLNWSENPGWSSGAAHYDPTRPVNEQVLDFNTFVACDEDGLWLGKKRVSVLSPKHLPDWLALPAMSRLIGEPMRGKDGISGNFLVTMNIRFPDPKKARDELERSKAIVDYQARGRLGQGIQSLRTRQQDFSVFMTGIESGERPCEVQHTFVLFSDSQEDSTKAVTQMQSFYRDMNMKVQPDQYACVPLFFGALPFGADPDVKTVKFLRRYRRSTSGLAAECAPLLADWKGTRYPVLSYVSRNGQPMALDIFETSASYNFVVAAESGSGKSFFANDLIVSYISTGARVYVIDVGRSYQKICDVLGGEFLVFGKDSPICLNPFELVKEFDDEAPMLQGLIKSMASPSGNISELGSEKIVQVITELWAEHGTATDVDMIAAKLRADDDLRYRDLGDQLFSFTSRGTYGKWFIGKNSVSFTKQLTVLELEELNDKKSLQTVILLQLLYQITQSLYVPQGFGEVKQRTLIIIDEAWALMNGDVGSFMITAYRRARKYNGAIGLITQSMNDLMANPTVGTPILENSKWKFLLAQTPDTVARLQENKVLTLPDGGFRLLQTVHRNGSYYSEIFIYTNAGGSVAAGIARLVVTRFAQLMYTTDPTEKNMIAERRRRGLSNLEAIQEIIAQEGRQ